MKISVMLRIITMLLLIVLIGCQGKNELGTTNELNTMDISQNNRVHSNPAWHPSGNSIVVKVDDTISFYDLEHHEWENNSMEEYSISRTKFAWNKDRLTFMGGDPYKDFTERSSIVLWDVNQNEYVHLKEGFPFLNSLSWNKNQELVYSVKAVEKNSFDVKLYDLNNNEDKLLFSGGTNVKWQPNKDSVFGYVSDKEIFIYDIKTKTKKLIYSSDEEILDNLTWSPDGKYIAFREGSYKKGIGLFILSLEDQVKDKIIESNVGSLSWSSTEDKIAYTTVGQPGSNKLYILDVPNKYK
ncbi:PD40 domain-containing protein [Aquisalibacillus elongatus]|uniref:WD40 repeat protein n=1 Tax=Aquisalibacillus elongatus TaxID=485577 RepID=A0A3N5BB07_9BACI|nr:PD40 domain-containing protein [Aquisalibacillus elongatus]RPF54139.1 WD40 repeat protein [Aquisalibacillus elongatus]